MRPVIKNFFLLFLLFHPIVSLAINCSPSDIWHGVDKENITSIATFIDNLKNFIVDCVAKPALVIVIVISGFYIMASTGNPAHIQRGKVALISALIGMIIIGLAGNVADGTTVFAIVFGIIIYVVSSVVK